MHAPLDESATPFVVADADQHRRESTRRLFDTRTTRADEEVGVHGPGRGAFERLERAILANDARKHASTAFSLRRPDSSASAD
jgi:hypothetical protein